jgi:Na+/proline symporter
MRLAVNYRLSTAAIVFFATLAMTFAAVLFARFRAGGSNSDEDLAGRNLNRWLIGLSAGTTGNSGFIVTGAVGLGYAGGVHWLLLPLSWLVGDLVYWSLFPDRLNRLARRADATTLSEMLTFDISGPSAKLISVTVSVLLVVFLTTYTSAQWLAGKKFLSGVFNLSDVAALVAFGATIVAYSSIGGFRGSVYADFIQAFIRIGGTLIALAGVAWFAVSDSAAFTRNISLAGPDFFNPFPGGTIITAAGFVAGYAFAAIGFGLGQPQIVTRYMAGSSPKETKAARWIYIGFLQFTWLAMTGFGVILRGVMPHIVDPETGLSVFFQSYMGSIVTGIIFADVFATIASTSNGLLVAISQTLRRDLIGALVGRPIVSLGAMTFVTLIIGLVTIALSFVLPGNVFSIAVDSISKIGAGLAGPVMIKVFGWRHTGPSLLMAILAGIAAAFAWSALGYSSTFNEAGVGLIVSLAVNLLVSPFGRNRDRPAAIPTETEA